MKKFISRFVFWEFVMCLIRRPPFRRLLSHENFQQAFYTLSETKKNECHKYTWRDGVEAWRDHARNKKDAPGRTRFWHMLGEE